MDHRPTRPKEDRRMTFRLADHGHGFSTRPRGVEVLALLDQAARPGDTIGVDFSDVLSVSYSFADEFVGKLAERQARGDASFTATISNVPEPLHRVIDRCLEARGLSPADCGWKALA